MNVEQGMFNIEVFSLLIETFIKLHKTSTFVIPGPYQLRDKPQPGSSKPPCPW
jgi:hypothetical protein